MKRKIAVLLATLALLATLGTVFALQWYYSAEQTSTSVDYTVTMGTIPLTMPRNQITQITGTVLLGSTPQTGVTVTLFLNGTATSYTDATDGAGVWVINYNNTQPAGTLMYFKAGIEV